MLRVVQPVPTCPKRFLQISYRHRAHLSGRRGQRCLLDRLVDAGRSVIVIEHHQAVMAHADWIIDLEPGAKHDGGRIVFEGPAAELVALRSNLTGQHPAEYFGG
jgi:hypothetical protein